MKVYLLWQYDPHQEETDVIDVYLIKEEAEIMAKTYFRTQSRKDIEGFPWFSYDVEERELIPKST
jgi:hypothetical protein